jgi:hypothetical protein
VEDFVFNYKFWGPDAGAESVYVDRLLYHSSDVRHDRPYRYACNTVLQSASAGSVLRRNAEAVFGCVFDHATSLHIPGDDHFSGVVIDRQPYKEIVPPGTVGIMKLRSPEVRFYVEFEKPPGNFDKPVLIAELTAEWLLEDLDGHEVWRGVVAGSGVYDYGIWDGFKKLIQRPFQPAVDDHFGNLACTLESSPEIRLYEACVRMDRGGLLSDPSSVHEVLGGIQDPQETRRIANKLVYLAIEKSSADLLKELLSTSLVDVNQQDKYYQRLPIHLAVQKGNLDAVKLLIASHSAVDAADSSGSTPLHYAASKGYTQITDLLIQNGADVNAKDADGETPFMLAARNDHRDDWQLLLDHGANAYAINEDLLWTADFYNTVGLYYAEKGKRGESAEALSTASDYYEKASSLYTRVSKKAEIDAFIKGVFEMTMLTVHAWGSQWQAQQRAKQYAELRALNDASEMGLSQTQTLALIRDYKSRALNSDATLAVGRSTPPSTMSRPTKADRVAQYYSQLSDLCRNAAIEVKGILECYEQKGANFKECIPPEPGR